MTMPTVDLSSILNLYRQHRHQDVLDTVKSIPLGSIEEPRVAFVIAASHFNLGHYQDALRFLESIEAELSTDASFLSLYGATCRRLGKLESARRLLKQAITADSSAKEPKNNYANLLIDLGDYKEARLILQSLVDDHPDYNDAITNLNRLAYRESVLEADRDQQNPRPVPSPVVSLPIDAESPWDPLAEAFSEQEIHDTQQRYRKSQRLSPVLLRKLSGSIPDLSNSQIAADQITLANALLEEGNSEKVLKLCTSILALQEAPSSPCYAIASQAYLRLGRTREAENCLLQSVVLGDCSFSSFVNLSSFALMRRDFSLALHYLDRAAGVDPSATILSSLRNKIHKGKLAANNEPFHFEDAWHNSDAQLGVQAPTT